MTSVKTEIESKLKGEFSPEHLEVINESHSHNVAPGSETHFKVVMASDAFEGKMAVRRHQAVYGVLADELENGVHALALHLYTPTEWTEAGAAPDSPNCMGGSKK